MYHYQVGCAKIDMTTFIYNKGMMGYAMHFNVAKSIQTPLHVRAFVIKDKKSDTKVCLVNAELCFYTIAIKDAVVKQLQNDYPELGYTDSNLVLAAQHTHSGPGGISHYLAYNLSIPGFQPKIFADVVKKTVEVIVAADKKLQDASLHFAQGTFEESKQVAFNRSLDAYNANPEVKKKITKKEAHLAVDRNMKLLCFKDKNNRAIGSINWFGVHTTSVSNDNHRICYDNKGYAAEFLEENRLVEKGVEDFVAVFAQDSAGDVSPNYKWDVDKKWTRGKYKNDFKSAAYNGKLQFKQAKKLLNKASKKPALKGGIDHVLMYVDFSDVAIDTEFSRGKKGLHTSPPALGMNMLLGTAEGPGIPSPLLSKAFGVIGNVASSAVWLYEKSLFKLFANRKIKQDIDLKYKTHGKKFIVLEAGTGKVLGTPYLQKLIVPASVDVTIERFKQLGKEGYARYTPWMPRVVPIQIVTIGEIAFACFAAEITTIAAQRLRKSLLRILKHKGIKEIIISAYSNGYHGYITTPQEYDFQLYEGAHTIFGKWTLPAYQTKFKELALALLKKPKQRKIDASVQPKIFAEEEIWYG